MSRNLVNFFGRKLIGICLKLICFYFLLSTSSYVSAEKILPNKVREKNNLGVNHRIS